MPAVYPDEISTSHGELISYGIDPADVFRRCASYMDRILKGENPGDLPVQNPTKFRLTISLKTARAIGLSVPPTLLALADAVTEMTICSGGATADRKGSLESDHKHDDAAYDQCDGP